MLSDGTLDLSALLTHEFALRDIAAALDAVRTRAGLKVAVRPGLAPTAEEDASHMVPAVTLG